MRRRKRRWAGASLYIVTPFVVFAMVLALPVLLSCALVGQRRRRRRLRAAAEAQPCPACGRPLGVAALEASDERWRDHVAELRRAHPGARLRLLRRVDACCTACGARLRFCKNSGTLMLSGATA